MSALAFDTYRYVKRLREAGVSEEAAAVHAEALNDTVVEALVTKAVFDTRIASLEANLRIEMRDQKVDLLKWLIPLMVGQVAAVAALVKLL